jgi:anaerobic ribonucleoside-triphosphate reductase activating protein
MENAGDILNYEVLAGLLSRYKNAITCVCFMGGDSEPKAIEKLSFFIRESTGNSLKTAWYSGKGCLPKNCSLEYFDYIKLGPYVEELGGLDSPYTNQHFYRIENGRMIDKTERFTKKMKG